MSIHYIEMDLRNKTISEFRTVSDSPLGVPNSQLPLYTAANYSCLRYKGLNKGDLEIDISRSLPTYDFILVSNSNDVSIFYRLAVIAP